MQPAVEPMEVATPAGRVAVHVFGAGLPTVLWHGLYVDGGGWGYALPSLLTGRRLIVVDAPGWGRSGRPVRGIGWDGMVEAARAVVTALSPGTPVDWVGEGWGGRIGLSLAARHPEAVRSLVMAMADPGPMPVEERRRVRRVLAGLAVAGPVGGIGRAIVADQLSPSSRTEPQTVGAVLDALLLTGRLRAARSVARFDVRRPDLTALLPGITAPVLMVAGDAASPWPAELAEAAAALAPFARTAAVPDARTLIALDRPGPLAGAVRAFWADLDLPA